MRGIDPQVELVPYALQPRRRNASTSTSPASAGRASTPSTCARERRRSRIGAVLMFHGYSGNSGDWSDKLDYVAQGLSVAALDCRGQGGLSEDAGGVKGNTLRGHIIRGLDDEPEKLLFRQIFLDYARSSRAS